LTKNLAAKEKQALIKSTELTKAETDSWLKLETRARKLETALRAPRIRKASHVYSLAMHAAPDEVLFLLYHSTLKTVQERLKNGFQKYLPAVLEITPEEWATVEGKPGTPRYAKAREAFIANRLDRRPKKPAEPTEPESPAPDPVAESATARRGR
jgi:hypothetical protein